MELWCFALLKGAALGLILAATSVSQAVLCTQETLNRGLIYGLISGLGVAVADTSFSLAAGFGVGYARALIQSYGSIMHISGACLILVFGMAMFAGKSDIDLSFVPEGRSRWSLANAFIPNFLITALHPVTLLFFSAAFASLPLLDNSSQSTTIGFIAAGVFGGAMIWWGGLAWSVDTFIKNRMSTGLLIKLKKSFAAILVLLGSGMLFKYTVLA